MEYFRQEKIFKIIQSNHQPSTVTPVSLPCWRCSSFIDVREVGHIAPGPTQVPSAEIKQVNHNKRADIHTVFMPEEEKMGIKMSWNKDKCA